MDERKQSMWTHVKTMFLAMAAVLLVAISFSGVYSAVNSLSSLDQAVWAEDEKKDDDKEEDDKDKEEVDDSGLGSLDFSLYSRAAVVAQAFNEQIAPGGPGSGWLDYQEQFKYKLTYANAGGLLGFPEVDEEGVFGWLASHTSDSSVEFSHEQLKGINEGLSDYSLYGATLNEYGLIEVREDGFALSRLAMGTLFQGLYFLANFVPTLLRWTLWLLTKLNPFAILGFGLERGAGSDLPFIGPAVNILNGLYKDIQSFSLAAVVPIMIGSTLFSVIALNRTKASTAFIKIFVRLFFIVGALPLIGSTFTSALNGISASMGGSSLFADYLITSSLVDVKNWAFYSRMQYPRTTDERVNLNMLRVGETSGTKIPSRRQVLTINALQTGILQFYNVYKEAGVGGSDDISNDFGGAYNVKNTDDVNLTGAFGSTFNEVNGLIDRYKSNEQYTSGQYEGDVKTYLGEEIKRAKKDGGDTGQEDTDRVTEWFSLDAGTLGKVSEIDDDWASLFHHGGHQGKAAEKLGPYSIYNASGVFKAGSPRGDKGIYGAGRWITFNGGITARRQPPANVNEGKGGLSPLAMYNFLNSEFSTTGLRVYSPTRSASVFSNKNHSSVTRAGKGFISIVTGFETIIVMTALTVLSFIYSWALLKLMLAAIPKIIASIVGVGFGSFTAVTKILLLATTLIVEILGTILLYLVSEQLLVGFMTSSNDILTFFTQNFGKLGREIGVAFSSIAMIILALLVIFIGVKNRGAFAKALEEMTATAIEKIMGRLDQAGGGDGSGVRRGIGQARAGGGIIGEDGTGSGVGLNAPLEKGKGAIQDWLGDSALGRKQAEELRRAQDLDPTQENMTDDEFDQLVKDRTADLREGRVKDSVSKGLEALGLGQGGSRAAASALGAKFGMDGMHGEAYDSVRKHQDQEEQNAYNEAMLNNRKMKEQNPDWDNVDDMETDADGVPVNNAADGSDGSSPTPTPVPTGGGSGGSGGSGADADAGHDADAGSDGRDEQDGHTDEAGRDNDVYDYKSAEEINRERQINEAKDDQGRRINKEGQLIDDNGQAWTDKEGYMVDKDGERLLNTAGQPMHADDYHTDRNGNIKTADGRLVDAQTGYYTDGQGNLSDEQGRRVNKKGHFINEQGDRVNEQGQLVDDEGYEVAMSDDGQLRRLADRTEDGVEIDRSRQTDVFVNDDGHLVNKQGHYVDVNGEELDEEALINGDIEPVSGVTRQSSREQTHAQAAVGQATLASSNEMLTPAQANARRLDAEGYHVNAEGKRLQDANGNELHANDYTADASGRLHAKDGSQVVDAESGYNVNAQGQLTDNEERLVNKQGQFINDKGERVNASGQRVDDQGNEIGKNANGHMQRLAQETAEGVQIDRTVNKEIFLDENDNLVDKNGDFVDETGEKLGTYDVLNGDKKPVKGVAAQNSGAQLVASAGGAAAMAQTTDSEGQKKAMNKETGQLQRVAHQTKDGVEVKHDKETEVFLDEDDHLVNANGNYVNAQGVEIDEQALINGTAQPVKGQGRTIQSPSSETFTVDASGQITDSQGQQMAMNKESGKLQRVAHQTKDGIAVKHDKETEVFLDEDNHLVNANGNYVNSQGVELDEQALINGTAQPVKGQGRTIQSSEQLTGQRQHQTRVNAQGQTVNEAGQLVNAQGQAVNDQGQLINGKGQVVNEQGSVIDGQGNVLQTYQDKTTGRTKAARMAGRVNQQVGQDGVMQADDFTQVMRDSSSQRAVLEASSQRVSDAMSPVKAQFDSGLDTRTVDNQSFGQLSQQVVKPSATDQSAQQIVRQTMDQVGVDQQAKISTTQSNLTKDASASEHEQLATGYRQASQTLSASAVEHTKEAERLTDSAVKARQSGDFDRATRFEKAASQEMQSAQQVTQQAELLDQAASVEYKQASVKRQNDRSAVKQLRSTTGRAAASTAINAGFEAAERATGSGPTELASNRMKQANQAIKTEVQKAYKADLDHAKAGTTLAKGLSKRTAQFNQETRAAASQYARDLRQQSPGELVNAPKATAKQVSEAKAQESKATDNFKKAVSTYGSTSEQAVKAGQQAMAARHTRQRVEVQGSSAKEAARVTESQRAEAHAFSQQVSNAGVQTNEAKRVMKENIGRATRQETSVRNEAKTAAQAASQQVKRWATAESQQAPAGSSQARMKTLGDSYSRQAQETSARPLKPSGQEVRRAKSLMSAQKIDSVGQFDAKMAQVTRRLQAQKDTFDSEKRKYKSYPTGTLNKMRMRNRLKERQETMQKTAQELRQLRDLAPHVGAVRATEGWRPRTKHVTPQGQALHADPQRVARELQEGAMIQNQIYRLNRRAENGSASPQEMKQLDSYKQRWGEMRSSLSDAGVSSDLLDDRKRMALTSRALGEEVNGMYRPKITSKDDRD